MTSNRKILINTLANLEDYDSSKYFLVNPNTLDFLISENDHRVGYESLGDLAYLIDEKDGYIGTFEDFLTKRLDNEYDDGDYNEHRNDFYESMQLIAIEWAEYFVHQYV